MALASSARSACKHVTSGVQLTAAPYAFRETVHLKSPVSIPEWDCPQSEVNRKPEPVGRYAVRAMPAWYPNRHINNVDFRFEQN